MKKVVGVLILCFLGVSFVGGLVSEIGPYKTSIALGSAIAFTALLLLGIWMVFDE